MLNEYDEVLTCLSKILNDKNTEHKFYSIDNLDDQYEYFSKRSEKNFSKEKFKEVMSFIEEQTEKIKNSELSEEILENVSGGGDDYVPETSGRRDTLVFKSLLPYFSDSFSIGRNIGKIVNLIMKKLKYEEKNSELDDLRNEYERLQKLVKQKQEEEEKMRRKNIIMTSEIK